MKKMISILPALVAGAVLFAPLGAQAATAVDPDIPDTFYYSDYWPITISCEDEPVTDGWMVYTWAQDPMWWDEEGGVWHWTDPVLIAEVKEVQWWEVDCPYVLGEDPNAYNPETDGPLDDSGGDDGGDTGGKVVVELEGVISPKQGVVLAKTGLTVR